MNLLWLVVLVLVILAVVGAPGVGPWQHNFGYFPSGIGVILVIILIVLLLTGRL